MTTSPPRAWAEINLTALDENLSFIRQHSGQEVMAILKAGAYGHGLVDLARHLDHRELPFFGVANVYEARKLHEAGIRTPIYLLGATFPAEREEVVARGWIPCFSTLAEIDHYVALCEKLDRDLTAHLVIDTGMGRGGFLPDQVGEALAYLARPACRRLHLTGAGSHLPSADEDEAFTRDQFATFDDLAQTHFSRGEKGFRLHLANSAGLLAYQSATTNLVRPGLLLYGIAPLPAWQEKVRPVMTLKSRLSLIRPLPAGHGVSYGRTHILPKDTLVGTIGAGYGDGLPRNLSGKDAYVLIRGQRAPLLGRVTMDQIMVDVSEIDGAQPGDQVELFGPNLPVTQVAQWADTISWEVLTRITPRVTRLYRHDHDPPVE
ncbi:alanine racemase [Roseibacillus ishigakijimensis]|uniref:Alanine racemase n=1 Tax=Roseibacillus ishigakijimensis TaxID=454146 RepID=A0A934RNF3_9BACT|nr:alanine racemase [Roseibacillus ishigakijimensis]MBK1834010.1 alanine racemase [Roseibacillus ishigakijimensis]